MALSKELAKELTALLNDDKKTKADIMGNKGREVVISPEDRQIIERTFSRGIRDGRELAQFIEQRCMITVAGIKIILSPELLRRLNGRRGMIPFEDFLSQLVINQLEHVAGLR